MKFQSSSLISFISSIFRWSSVSVAILFSVVACAHAPREPVSASQDQSRRSLLAMITAELEESLAEKDETGLALGVVPRDFISDPAQQTHIAEVCVATDATDFFEMFAAGATAEQPIEIEALAASVYASRTSVGFYDEDHLPQDDSASSLIPWHAALDAALGRWKTVHYHNVVEESDLNAAEIAIVWRTWCRVAIENDRLLGDYLRANGFPTEASTSRQISGMALALFKHSSLGSPTEQLYVQLAGEAYRDGQLPAANYAMILDTDAQKHGRPLPFATYVECRDGDAVVSGEVEDETHLDERRAEYGLPPLEEHLAQLAPVCALAQR